ncbi:MAG: L-aspartate oxidase [Planctomycetaceae bacterium]|jgi:L-aspartate oxidase|nr:L-aspartate oxidase [Planctomycetaceae bacterium]
MTSISSTGLTGDAIRYLVPFHPKLHPHFFTDILIIGGGLAGFRAALAVHPSLRVLLVTKAGLNDSNSSNAQGGIAAVWDKSDTLAEHVADTLVAGGELCEERVVEHVVQGGPEQIRKLIEIGVKFDLNESGSDIDLSREGGHGRERILHANGDSTGRELMRGLIAEIKRRPNIRVWENTFALDLLTHHGECYGTIAFWGRQDGRGEKEIIWAKQTILAAGGIGQVYRETTNPDVATGDGVAMAYRAGAEVRDMEFVQFHPTVLYIAGGVRSLITEAMRGEGAYLLDKNGYRFMFDYDKRGELAPRDVVSNAIVAQMSKTNHPNVYLDCSHKDAAWVRARFPGVAEVCGKFGVDIGVDKIPVRPGVHYAMGGVTADIDGRTTVPRLWAAGEVSCTGLHGANRLASNSLLEAMIYGESSGRMSSQEAMRRRNDYHVEPLENKPFPKASENIDVSDLRNALKSLMWRHAGVVRNGGGLTEAASNIERWSYYIFGKQFDAPAGWELQNMLTVARLIVRGAISREESRGSHQRQDFPSMLPDGGKTHYVWRKETS